MSDFTDKLRRVEEEIAEDKGALNLFALLEREDLAERWDLVIAAPWAKEDEPTLRYVDNVVKRHLTPQEVTLLSRIVILEPSENSVRALNEIYEVEHGRIHLLEPERFGLPVKHGFIITSRRAA